MTVLCCCRSRRAACLDREPGASNLQLPVQPRTARLSSARSLDAEGPAAPIEPLQASAMLMSPLQSATINLTDLDVGDSGSEEELENTRNSSTSTLEVLKSKLMRRLSQMSDDKRQSGYSDSNDNELARRAELKRLMHRRIQEEIENEQEEMSEPRRFCDHQHCWSGKAAVLPNGGPRDTVELVVPSVDLIKGEDQTMLQVRNIQPAFPAISGTLSPITRRSSFPGSLGHSRGSPSADLSPPLRGRGSMPQIPSPPHLAPVRLPSIPASESIGSWRLSYSPTQIASHEDSRNASLDQQGDIQQYTASRTPETQDEPQGPLGRDQKARDPEGDETTAKLDTVVGQSCHEASFSDHEISHIPPSNSQSINRRYSPLDLWLRIQGLEPLSRSPTRRHTVAIQSAPSQPAPQFLYPNQCERLIKVRSSSSISDLRKDIEISAVADEPTEAPDSILEVRENEKHRQKTSLEAKQGSTEHGPDYSSSEYSTRPTTSQPTPSIVCATIPELFSHSSKIAISPSLPLSRNVTPGRETKVDSSEASSYKTAPLQASAPHVVASNHTLKRRLSTDTASLVPSETASYKQREAELASVAKRFVGGSFRRDRTGRVVSRFREEFNLPQPSRETGKPSILSKFHLLPKKGRVITKVPQPGRLHARGNHHCVADAIRTGQLHDAQITARKTPALVVFDRKPAIVESATGLWQRAIRLEVDRRQLLLRDQQSSEKQEEQNRRTHSLSLAREGRGTNSNNVETNHIRSFVRSEGDLHPLLLERTPKRRAICENGRTSLARGEQSLRSHPQVQRDGSELGEICGIPKHGLREGKPPRPAAASWSRWPSHSRPERNGVASVADHVVSRDFALTDAGRAKSASGKARSDSPANNQLMPRAKTLSGKFGRAVKGGLSKLIPSRDTVANDLDNFTQHYRQRREPTAYLEYPELEILPTRGEYQELQALERQIDSIAHPPRRAQGNAGRTGNRESGGISLSARLAQKVREVQHGNLPDSRSDSHDDISGVSFRTPPPIHNTIATPRALSTNTVDHFETPVSHVSYEDCVPKHMLDGNDSIKSENAAIEIGRSRSNVEHRLPGQTKSLTWSHRSRTRPELLQRKSVKELSDEIWSELKEEREKMLGMGAADRREIGLVD